MHLSFQKIFYAIAIAVALFAILVLAKEVLIPISFGFLISFILFPVAQKLESWGTNEIASAFLSIFGMLLIIAGAIFLFSNQIVQLSENISDFKGKVLEALADATIYINQNIGILPKLEKGELLEKIKDWLNKSSGRLLSQTFNSTASVVFTLLTSIIFTFLVLIYKKGLARALVGFYPQEHRERAFYMLKSVQRVGKQYLFGMMIMILILGFVNSIGLWIIGIDNPFLFGFLAGALAIIPYVGTVVGAAIPIIFAFITYDSIWMPLSIAIFFWVVQFIESNFLSPKIVGGNLKINAFTSILSIIIGSAVWGIAGMIIFLPFAAMFKVICQEYVQLKPVALLIGEENYIREDPNDKLNRKWIKKIKTWFSRFKATFKKDGRIVE